jgi:hypothetical protein
MSEVERRETSKFKEWYSRNKGKVNSKRKKKYREDSKYRANIIAKQRDYRKNNPDKIKRETVNTIVLNGVTVQVHRIGKLCDVAAVDKQTIRNWESRGIIPEPSIKSKHRRYTDNQIAIIASFAENYRSVRYDGKARKNFVEIGKTYIEKHWED